MDCRVSVGVKGPVARIPTPPALETAATSSGVEIQDMPGRMMGYLHLNKEVIRVGTEAVAVMVVVDVKNQEGVL